MLKWNSFKAGATVQIDLPAIDEHFHSALSKDRQTGGAALAYPKHIPAIISVLQKPGPRCRNRNHSKCTSLAFSMWAGFFLCSTWCMRHIPSCPPGKWGCTCREHLPTTSGQYQCFPNITDLSIHTIKSSQVTSMPGKQSSNQDGQPSEKKQMFMFEILSGHEAHTDRNESNFGHLSQQLRKEPTARLQTVKSKVAMCANDTFTTVRNCPELLAVVGQTRKLEREESLKMICVQLFDVAQLNEPHLAELREVAARRHKKRPEKKRHIVHLCRLSTLWITIMNPFSAWCHSDADVENKNMNGM